MTRLLCDLPWFDWHGCFVVFHIKFIVVPCASTLLLFNLDVMWSSTGCCVIIQPLDILGCCVIILMLVGSGPWVVRGGIILKSKVAHSGYEVSLGLSKPMTSGVRLCLLCEEICTTSAAFSESIRIATSLEWATARMRSQMIRLRQLWYSGKMYLWIW
jgi:hypothetical protein